MGESFKNRRARVLAAVAVGSCYRVHSCTSQQLPHSARRSPKTVHFRRTLLFVVWIQRCCWPFGNATCWNDLSGRAPAVRNDSPQRAGSVVEALRCEEKLTPGRRVPWQRAPGSRRRDMTGPWAKRGGREGHKGDELTNTSNMQMYAFLAGNSLMT